MKPNFNNYHEPQNINCPQDYLKVIKVIYDGTLQNGSYDFSLALIEWDGEPSLAIRWNHSMREELDIDKRNNVKKCLGMPISFSHPVWFVLPKVMHAAILSSMSGFANEDVLKYATHQLLK